MTSLEARFRREIEEANFNLFEIKGFQERPVFALMAGMAMGYKMGFEDCGNRLAQRNAHERPND